VKSIVFLNETSFGIFFNLSIDISAIV
jgi:hypothetical protein